MFPASSYSCLADFIHDSNSNASDDDKILTTDEAKWAEFGITTAEQADEYLRTDGPTNWDLVVGYADDELDWD